MTTIAQMPSAIPAEVLLQIAISHIKTGDVVEGQMMLREVIARLPCNAEAWFWMGRVAANQQELRTAERCFIQAFRRGHPHALCELNALHAPAEAACAIPWNTARVDRFGFVDGMIDFVVSNRMALGLLLAITLVVAAITVVLL